MSRELFAAHFAFEPRIAKRAWQVTFAESGCWLWPAETGYAQIWMNGKPAYVHRISLELKLGQSLGHLEARHDCDTPLCVNPAHLRPGTAADNARDRMERGRSRTNPVRGIRHSKATVTDAEIVDALDLVAGGASLGAVGRRYGVSAVTVLRWRDGTFRREAHDAWLERRAS